MAWNYLGNADVTSYDTKRTAFFYPIDEISSWDATRVFLPCVSETNVVVAFVNMRIKKM